ncbi:hypothetical protein HMP09_2647 [Sphingomonas sp. HMP9]|nr:hypothetical protein HMP09_2647 [Sphingomonas sp. HMP9]
MYIVILEAERGAKISYRLWRESAGDKLPDERAAGIVRTSDKKGAVQTRPQPCDQCREKICARHEWQCFAALEASKHL